MFKNSESQYGVVAKGFHWLLFLMLTFSVIAGNLLASMPKGAEKLEAAGMHKSFGAVILMLIFARLASKTPALQSPILKQRIFLVLILMELL